jgi:hypothetical protein
LNKIGYIEIKVVGYKGNIKLSPDTYDVKEIISILQNIEDLLYAGNKKDRPLISYNIQEGSVKHVFKTGLQAVIGLNAILGSIVEKQNINFLELKTAIAIENIQKFAYQKNYEFELTTSLDKSTKLTIDTSTKFVREEEDWVETELYFYGTLTNAGGKNKVNVHLDTEEYGSLTIETDKMFLMDQEENLLYKKYGLRVKGRQNIVTGELDKSFLNLVELIDYSPNFDEEYLNKLISKAKKNWSGINTDDWLNSLRGEYG